jgi:4-amino-4-deoxy-L-arabinose transferase-like glycosyltransferase
MKIIKITVLVLVFALAAFLRFYKLDKIPPSLNWDEIAAGYNAYTIANWGADEYGNKFPVVFKSFGDDKHPVHIYLTAMVVKIFGLSDYATRASSALVGTLTVVAFYFLAKKLFKSEMAGIFAAIFLAVSPYHLQFSRGLWEANFALFFFILGLTLFYYGVEEKKWLVPVAFVSFGLSFFSYHSAKIVVPPTVLFLCLVHFKKLIKYKWSLAVGIIVVLLFGFLVVKDPRILGLARVNQTRFSQKAVNEYGGVWQTYLHNYKSYFTYSYLFQKGDQNPRASVKVVGEFYKLDLILVSLGLLIAVLKMKWKTLFLLTLWLAIAPVPGAVSSLEPTAIRGIFMLGPVLLLSAFGAASLVSLLPKKILKVIGVIGILSFFGVEAGHYLKYYYVDYARAEGIEWQYGLKQVVEYLRDSPKYNRVYMDNIRQQPYIFFLYYLKTPLPELLATVKYETSQAYTYNTVFSYNKFQFGGWDIINSYPNLGVIYVVTPSYFSGLRYATGFEVKKLIKYPNGNDAFYIVDKKE